MVSDNTFYECETSQMGGCIYAELNELFVSKQNCFWRCIAYTQTHTFRCVCPKSVNELSAFHLCAPDRIAAYGSYHFLESNAHASGNNCSSCQINRHGPSGYFTTSDVVVERQNTFNCTGNGIIVLDNSYSLDVDMINYYSNTQTSDGHFTILGQPSTPHISNGIFYGNSRNAFYYGTPPIWSNCIFDVEIQISNTNCQFGVDSPSTLAFKEMGQCREITRTFSFVESLLVITMMLLNLYLLCCAASG